MQNTQTHPRSSLGIVYGERPRKFTKKLTHRKERRGGSEIVKWETGIYKIYFRIPFTIYFVAYDTGIKKWFLARKRWNGRWGAYTFKKI